MFNPPFNAFIPEPYCCNICCLTLKKFVSRYIGRADIDDLTLQHLPVERALAQDRVRLLIADDVGLGKPLEARLITSELALRGRAGRILVVTARAMLTQFQKEFWTRFSIPLSRLYSAAIRRMRNRIPAHSMCSTSSTGPSSLPTC